MSARVHISRAEWLLWAGVVLGLSLSVVTLARPAKSRDVAFPENAVAVVNGRAVSVADYDAELRVVLDGTRRPLTEDDKHAAVERLVEQELMLEHGLSLDMARRDQPTRHALLGAVYDAESSAASAREPTDAELAAFYDGIRDTLRRPGKLHVRQLVTRAEHGLDTKTARARADEATARLRAGEPFASVNAALGAPSEPTLSEEPVSAEELGSRTGPVTLEHVLALEPGQVTDPLGNGGVFRVIQLVSRDPESVPPLFEVRERVLSLYRRKTSDAAFDARMASLRKSATVRIAEKLP